MLVYLLDSIYLVQRYKFRHAINFSEKKFFHDHFKQVYKKQFI